MSFQSAASHRLTMEKDLLVPSVVRPCRFMLIGKIKGLHYWIIPPRKIKKRQAYHLGVPASWADTAADVQLAL